jgi:hypothetical protein
MWTPYHGAEPYNEVSGLCGVFSGAHHKWPTRPPRSRVAPGWTGPPPTNAVASNDCTHGLRPEPELSASRLVVRQDRGRELLLKVARYHLAIGLCQEQIEQVMGSLRRDGRCRPRQARRTNRRVAQLHPRGLPISARALRCTGQHKHVGCAFSWSNQIRYFVRDIADVRLISAPRAFFGVR